MFPLVMPAAKRGKSNSDHTHMRLYRNTHMGSVFHYLWLHQCSVIFTPLQLIIDSMCSKQLAMPTAIDFHFNFCQFNFFFFFF